MNIVVCIKPQLSGADVVYATDTGQPVRPTIASMGVTDEIALQAALDFRKQYGGTVTVLSVAGSEVDDSLTHCLERGADRALRIEYTSDDGVLDTAAAARQAAESIRSEGADIIFCASKSDDTGSGYFPYVLAANSDYPLVTAVIDLELHGETVKAVRKLERGWRERHDLTLPLVIGVGDELARPRHSAVLGRGYREAIAVSIEYRDAADSGVAHNTAVQELELALPQARRRPIAARKSRGSSRELLRRKRPGGKSTGGNAAGPVRLDGDPADIGRQLVAAIRGWLKAPSDET